MQRTNTHTNKHARTHTHIHKRPVEHTPRFRASLRGHNHLAILGPDARHLVHMHQGGLVRLPELLPRTGGDALVPNGFGPLLQVRMPQLVTTRELFQGPFMKSVALSAYIYMIGRNNICGGSSSSQ
jgi:hypothetical protein